MYAIVKSGGRQYRVAPGDKIKVDRLAAEIDAQVALDQVLLLSDGQAVKVGSPYLEGTRVLASVVDHDRAKKILVFKKKRRQGYHKAKGHRQDYTELKIASIEAGGEAPAAETAPDQA